MLMLRRLRPTAAASATARRGLAVANTARTPGELAATIASWGQVPYSPGPLSEAQVKQFHEEGFVVVHDIVPHEFLEGAKSAINDLTSNIAKRLKMTGRIEDDLPDEPFASRLIKLDEQFEHTNVLLHKNGVLPGGIQDLWSHPHLLDAASQILGEDEDIMGHPVWNIRCKTPEALSQGQATVPWHQDNSYLSEECWDKLQVTAWVPLVDATLENGCMQVLRQGHLPGVTATHSCCVGGTWYNDLEVEEMEKTILSATGGRDVEEETVTCEVPFGGVLFLNNVIPHRSMVNNTNDIRWSLDLRWQRAGEPNGFHGLKESVLMRDGKDRSKPVQWAGFADVDRTKLQKGEGVMEEEVTKAVEEAGEAEGAVADGGEFDTTISGPWMHRWDLTHHNRHTATLAPEEDGPKMHGWGS